MTVSVNAIAAGASPGPGRTAGPIGMLSLRLASCCISLALAGFALFADDAAARERPAPVRLSEVGAGSLLFRTETPGLYLPAPMVRTDVRMDIAGPVARVVVDQRFYNPTDQWLEGVYVFPLPENAAVHGLRLRIGDRYIEGRIRERAEAKRTYERARAEGRKASLIEQKRPNVFTASVANLGPGEDVVVEIEYRQTLRFDGDAYSLRFPMVVAPRYAPGGPRVASFAAPDGGAGGPPETDADDSPPPVLHPSQGKINPVSMEVRLDPGFPLAWVRSASHEISVSDDGGRPTVTFAADTVAADRDFVLAWKPRASAEATAALFTETVGEAAYALIFLMPPSRAPAVRDAPPREMIFVIDTSGSMAGPSIRQAKEALLMAIGRLTPRDSFNVIAFSDRASRLFPAARRAGPEALAAARRYVRRLAAEGGTEMMPALRLALEARNDPRRLRQVIFLTDGGVANEAELFRYVKARLGHSRLFTVGIGSAPNGYFMRKAAEYGRGTFTYIGSVDEVRERMTALFAKLESPVITDITVRFPDDPGAEAWPAIVPDVYRGEPLVVAARLSGLRGRAVISGRRAGAPWSVELPLAGGRERPGVGFLWARRKIAGLMDGLHAGAAEAEVRAQVIRVALAHGLVSRYTSLVAVDVTRARPEAEGLESRRMPLNLPEGWDYEKVFGENPAPRPKWDLPRKAGAPGAGPPVRLALASAPPEGGGATVATLQQLPRGATPATLKLLMGLAALLLAGALWSWRRRRA